MKNNKLDTFLGVITEILLASAITALGFVISAIIFKVISW
jgi:hypothetical protein